MYVSAAADSVCTQRCSRQQHPRHQAVSLYAIRPSPEVPRMDGREPLTADGDAAPLWAQGPASSSIHEFPLTRSMCIRECVHIHPSLADHFLQTRRKRDQQTKKGQPPLNQPPRCGGECKYAMKHANMNQ
eukprot:GHVU01203091.1.p2 GENE.GHVU01203091.1~~GHVU01203091.1.p2  ORF type:complete len:130 (-),score=6.49 GHVU01203091.1:166-555(-)